MPSPAAERNWPVNNFAEIERYKDDRQWPDNAEQIIPYNNGQQCDR